MSVNRKLWLSFLLAMAALVAAFAFGRFTAQRKVEVQTKIEYVDKEVIKEIRTFEWQEQEKKIIYRDRWVKPDGTVHEHEEERTETKADTTAAEVRVEEKVVIKEVEKRVEVKTALPDWRAGVLIGIDTQLRPAYGVEVQRRILGPFSVGVWGLSGPNAIGGSLSLEF